MDDCKKPAESCSEQLPFLEQESLCCSDIEDLLDSYLDGELVAQLDAKFQSHISECEICEELVHDCRQLISLARSLNDTPIPQAVQSRLREALKREVGFDISDPNPRSTAGRFSVVKSGS